MANIHIKELFGSDNITDLTEKINFNFDQLILAGGGPQGPIGGTGAAGPAGPAGIRGSQWIGASGSAGATMPTDGVFREHDFKLNPNGDVDYYVGSAFVTTGINLRGPKGDTGGAGDGSISILPGKTENYNNPDGTPVGNHFVPTISNLGIFITGADADDEDDYQKGGAGYINAGVDFIGIGRGNNSLVLGRYATLFSTGAGGTEFIPPGGNDLMKNFPQLEADVPMLFISQNDYQDPSNINNTYKNGISIGLTKSHPDADYGTGDPYSGQQMNYDNNANISIENKYHDLKISSSQMITLSASSNSSFFRLGTTIPRTIGSPLDDITTKLHTQQYTNFKINNSFFTDLSDISDDTSGKELITRAESTYVENTKVYISPNDYRQNTSKSFIANNGWADKDANEIVLFNSAIADNDSLGKRRIPYSTNQDSIELDSNYTGFGFRIGQTVVNPGRMDGTGPTTGIPTVVADKKIHINYQGFGYDQAFIQYSGLDTRNDAPASSNINSSTLSTGGGVFATIPNNSTLQNALGYNIFDPLFNEPSQKGSRSMTRMGIYPGFFRKEKNDAGLFVGDADARQKKFFDVAHRMMPTGSLDVFGTVRIREQETTDNGAKDGWIAVNKKDGIIGFEEPSQASSTPTFSIIMFPEMASNKFSFYVASTKNFGSGYPSGSFAYQFKAGSTASPFSAFPGKGSDELKDYYICNGAVLADSRDCIATGPFSKMKGMNIDANNGSERVVNNQRLTSISGNTDFDYEVNPDFISPDGSVDNNHGNLYISSKGKSLAKWFVDIMNGVESTTLSTSPTINRMFDYVGARNWGESVLAPSGLESGFRVVLPNYFGRVAKMQFPNSTSIVRAITGGELSQDWGSSDVSPGSTVESGYIYHKTNLTYNQSWMMKSMFDSGGFPYINGLQMPKTVTDVSAHKHDKGTYSILNPEEYSETQDFSTSTTLGAHTHLWTNNLPYEAAHHNVDGQRQQTATADDTSVTDIAMSGGHGHGNTTFSGESGLGGGQILVTTAKSWIDGQGNDYDTSQTSTENYGKTGFKISKWFAYDVGSGNNGLYSNFSNWINYNVTSGLPDSSGQKFISPPFKGTIMAINLKGLKNPNRNNSIIEDLHFVGGVPRCGVDTNDMSWYSYIDDPSEVLATSVSEGCATTFLDTSILYSSQSGPYETIITTYAYGRPHMNAYEYGYKRMSRNDDTMHPDTYVKGTKNKYASTLDYNAASNTDKKRNDLYYTHLNRRDNFNT